MFINPNSMDASSHLKFYLCICFIHVKVVLCAYKRILIDYLHCD